MHEPMKIEIKTVSYNFLSLSMRLVSEWKYTTTLTKLTASWQASQTRKYYKRAFRRGDVLTLFSFTAKGSDINLHIMFCAECMVHFSHNISQLIAYYRAGNIYLLEREMSGWHICSLLCCKANGLRLQTSMTRKLFNCALELIYNIDFYSKMYFQKSRYVENISRIFF